MTGTFGLVADRENPPIPAEARFQIILPPGHHTSRLIFTDAHINLIHCG